MAGWISIAVASRFVVHDDHRTAARPINGSMDELLVIVFKIKRRSSADKSMFSGIFSFERGNDLCRSTNNEKSCNSYGNKAARSRCSLSWQRWVSADVQKTTMKELNRTSTQPTASYIRGTPTALTTLAIATTVSMGRITTRNFTCFNLPRMTTTMYRYTCF